MQLAAGESMWPVLGGAKWMRQFHGVVATPIAPGELYGGFVLWTAIRVDARRGRVPARRRGARRGAVGVGRARDPGRRAVRGRVLRAARRVSRSRSTPTLSFPMIMRLGVLPLFLFSGTFFPISQLPSGLRPFAVLSPLWHGVELGARRDDRARSTPAAIAAHIAVLVGVRRGRRVLRGVRTFARRLSVVSRVRRTPVLAARSSAGAAGRGGSSNATSSRTGASGTSS